VPRWRIPTICISTENPMENAVSEQQIQRDDGTQDSAQIVVRKRQKRKKSIETAKYE
jgi:hypothetical protein